MVVFTESDSTVKSIYFQTKEMARMFDTYPVLLIDANYKLNDSQMPYYMF